MPDLRESQGVGSSFVPGLSPLVAQRPELALLVVAPEVVEAVDALVEAVLVEAALVEEEPAAEQQAGDLPEPNECSGQMIEGNEH